MKLQGKKPEKANYTIVVLPRTEGEDLVFKLGAVLEDKEFDELVPIPEAPTIVRPGGVKEKDHTDKKFMESFRKRWALKETWFFIHSLSATENLEFEQVDLKNPDTWEKVYDELKEFFITGPEIAILKSAAFDANSLNDSKIEEARKSFLASQAEKAKQVVS